MPLQGEAKTRYQREYMRRRREALRVPPPSAAPAPAPAKLEPKPKSEPRSKHCSFCNEPPSRERVVILIESDDRYVSVHICESCVAQVAELIAARRSTTVHK